MAGEPKSLRLSLIAGTQAKDQSAGFRDRNSKLTAGGGHD